MTIAQIFRKSVRRRRAHLAIAILPDAASAFKAYRLLQLHGISPEHLVIVGEGYTRPEWVGLSEPTQLAIRKASQLSLFGGVIASGVGCFTILLLVAFGNVLPSLGLFFSIPIAGLLGALTGAAIGAIVGYWAEGSMSSFYRRHLRRGHYLLMLEGPAGLIQQGQLILRQYSPMS